MIQRLIQQDLNWNEYPCMIHDFERQLIQYFHYNNSLSSATDLLKYTISE